MLACEFCFSQQTPLLFTRCCKSMICGSCCERQDKKLTCLCGRILPQGKKNYSECPQLVDIFKRMSEGKDKQCDRCDCKAQYECDQCGMVFCPTCNAQVHNGLGFAKHDRSKIGNAKYGAQRPKKKQPMCQQHNQQITIGCECGAALCAACSKMHKEICPKGFRSKLLREFKEEYNVNVLIKMRQLSFFKQKLGEDRQKYIQHFKNQQESFETSQRLICEQFEYLNRLLEIKYAEAKTRMTQYWQNCEAVYSSSLMRIGSQIKKYDTYGELLQLFSENMTNLDYFDKKIKKYGLNFQFANFKTANIDLAQSAIISISVAQKNWEQLPNDILVAQNFDLKQNFREETRLFGNIQNTSQLILDYTQNPSNNRQLNLLASNSQIYFNFIHLPFQNLKYQVEYGVGMKMKGQQIFKRINSCNGFGMIEGLNSNTKYRVRMRVVDGQWGPVSEIVTLDIPKFNLENSLCAKAVSQNSVQLGKGSVIYGSNEINFGLHKWVIKLTSRSISYEDSETACMSVGVSNKQTKKATFVGTTLNYGYQKSEIVLKILLDCSQKRLTITNVTSNSEQTYQNLPNFPLFPTIQNKGNAQILVRYNLTTDDSTTC